MNPRKSIGRKKAIALGKSCWWKSCSDREIAEFQLTTEELCCPFGIFHKAVEGALGRSVWIHELASDNLRQELLGKREPPTIQEIIKLIPEDKRAIVLTP